MDRTIGQRRGEKGGKRPAEPQQQRVHELEIGRGEEVE